MRAVDDDLHEVCRHRLGFGAINTFPFQYFVKVGIEACSVLAGWSGPWRLLRPRCRHGTSVAVGATAGCWLFDWRQERSFTCDSLANSKITFSLCAVFFGSFSPSEQPQTRLGDEDACSKNSYHVACLSEASRKAPHRGRRGIASDRIHSALLSFCMLRNHTNVCCQNA